MTSPSAQEVLAREVATAYAICGLPSCRPQSVDVVEVLRGAARGCLKVLGHPTRAPEQMRSIGVTRVGVAGGSFAVVGFEFMAVAADLPEGLKAWS